MDKDLIVTVDDLRDFRASSGKLHCVKGMRLWAKSHNLDFDEFVREGISAQRLLDTGDALAEEIVAAAKERTRG